MSLLFCMISVRGGCSVIRRNANFYAELASKNLTEQITSALMFKSIVGATRSNK